MPPSGLRENVVWLNMGACKCLRDATELAKQRVRAAQIFISIIPIGENDFAWPDASRVYGVSSIGNMRIVGLRMSYGRGSVID
jgi:hypothetical protein